MSTIVTSNVSDGTLSIPTTYVTNGSAKAWVNFNGTGTIAARDSLNVTSLTDNGVGQYVVNLTSSMGNTNYSWVIGAWNNGAGNGAWNAAGGSGSYPAGVAVGALGLLAFDNSGNYQDQDAYCAAILGDLA
jgi:hypothetical protein